MKRRLLLPFLLLFTLFTVSAFAETALDITKEALFKDKNHDNYHYLSDRKTTTSWMSGELAVPYLDVHTDTPCCGVMIAFHSWRLEPWYIQVRQGKEYVTVATGAGLYAVEYVPLEGLTDFRICYEKGKKRRMYISDIFLYSAGEAPVLVQQWRPTLEKADLMLLSAHPDDELLWFSGVLPTYAGERKMKVLVCYLTCESPARRVELLNGLWACGVRDYPVIIGFEDIRRTSLVSMYDTWGKRNVLKAVTAVIRQYRPEVLITHDVEGEYGHGAHRVCADAALECVGLAADSEKYPESAGGLSAWQVKKLYLHLYAEHAITLDFDVPLASQNGETAFETAVRAYREHQSQNKKSNYFVQKKEDTYNSCTFGLAYSAVGEDVVRNDLFENIELP